MLIVLIEVAPSDTPRSCPAGVYEQCLNRYCIAVRFYFEVYFSFLMSLSNFPPLPTARHLSLASKIQTGLTMEQTGAALFSGDSRSPSSSARLCKTARAKRSRKGSEVTKVRAILGGNTPTVCESNTIQANFLTVYPYMFPPSVCSLRVGACFLKIKASFLDEQHK